LTLLLDKASLNVVILMWYLLNIVFGSPSEKMHAHPRSRIFCDAYLTIQILCQKIKNLI